MPYTEFRQPGSAELFGRLMDYLIKPNSLRPCLLRSLCLLSKPI